MINKVAIIGSNSFSASHLIKVLLKKNISVVGISRSPEYKSLYLPYKEIDNSNFEFHKLDLNTEIEKIINVLDYEKAEIVVNYAAQGMVAESWLKPLQWYRTNTIGTIELVNNLKDKSYLQKYIHISTPEVYGSTVVPSKENSSYNPSTPYAASKASADIFIQLLIKNFKFPATLLRYPNVYGSHQQLFRIIPKSIIHMKMGRKINLDGGGYQKRSFIDIRDVCNAIYKVMVERDNESIYHFSLPTNLSIRDLVKKIAYKMNQNFSDVVTERKERKGNDDQYLLDYFKAQSKLKWKAKISLDNGLDNVIDWINKNWDEIQKEPLDYVHKK